MPQRPWKSLRRWLAAASLAVVASGVAAVRAADVPAPAPEAAPQSVGRLHLPTRFLKPVIASKSDEEKPDRKVFEKWQPTGQPITLGQSLQIGLERQPAVKAAQASMAAGQAGYYAVMNIHRVAELVRPDLPIRRKQAERGLAVGMADVLKAQQENTYDITRMYYSYVYAGQQEQTAQEISEQMQSFYNLFLELLRNGGAGPNSKINTMSLYAFEDAITEVRKLREKASLGRKQAFYAWKEAMGVGPETNVYPADKELPIMAGTVTLEHTVELALGRRAELVQAAVAVDVSRLEVCAQDRIRSTGKVDTFASGSDIHSHSVPMPLRNGEYRPGAVSPEMPVSLAGKREDRVARACNYAEHQDWVYGKVVGLVRLEATNAFLHWESSVERAKEAKARYERGQKIVEETRRAMQAKPDPELLVRNEALAGRAQSEYVEAIQKQIEALITLEKVTGGAVVPVFPGR